MKKLLMVAILASGLLGNCDFWMGNYIQQAKYLGLLLEDYEYDQARMEYPHLIDLNRKATAACMNLGAGFILDMKNERQILLEKQKEIMEGLTDETR